MILVLRILTQNHQINVFFVVAIEIKNGILVVELFILL